MAGNSWSRSSRITLPAAASARAASRATPRDSASLFAALGDETRLRLVSRLCDGGPSSIARLAEDFDVSRQAITKHLRLMEQAGLLRHARRGRETVWRLSENRLEDARRYLDRISKQWDDSLVRLRRFVED